MQSGTSYKAVGRSIFKVALAISLVITGLYAGIRFYEAFGPLLYASWNSLGSLERMILTLILLSYFGAIIALATVVLRNKIRFTISVRDQQRKIALISAGSITKLPLLNKEINPELPEAVLKAFCQSTLLIAYNPLEGGVRKFRGKIGSIKRTIIKGVPTYIMNVRHSNQDVRYAEAQRRSELPFARKLIRQVERARRSNTFSVAIRLLGHGITSYTCDKHFPKPSANTHIVFVVADQKMGGDSKNEW
ncbi:MAG: hypothetical protein B7O98_08890 [Zestosphaera tikiterensis]|uniref:Uncharacterized protein n=1 Tax=Zestosphaera tikiterensis TaxID=1973259 RepID=A0A2R7Y2C5_9CREN|nr:MAG: hypothetical protein B7O98_08720 [Zestosphaera tikiterensis]PUA31729.1 MAG: hypothetical protein B7O98_08890 [Zestosphaera tikiterensis]